MIDPSVYIRERQLRDDFDLRQPAAGETPLSPSEVAVGLADGVIPRGPMALRMAGVSVLEPRRDLRLEPIAWG